MHYCTDLYLSFVVVTNTSSLPVTYSNPLYRTRVPSSTAKSLSHQPLFVLGPGRSHSTVSLPSLPTLLQYCRRRQHDPRQHAHDEYPRRPRPGEPQVGPRFRRVPHDVVESPQVQAVRSRPVALAFARGRFALRRARPPRVAAAGLGQRDIGWGGWRATATAALDWFQWMQLQDIRQSVRMRRRFDNRRSTQCTGIHSRLPPACTSFYAPQ